jgi:hypothetical protein
MLAVLNHQEPDHVPLLFNPFGFKPPSHLQWSTAEERVKAWASLGVDDWLVVHAPSHTYHPDVKVRQWKETISGERWPCMIAEYDTPAGMLRQEVFETDDWMTSDWPSHGSSEISLLDDYNVPRYRSPTIETEADLEKLAYLLGPVSDEDITRFHKEAAGVGRRAAELGVLMIGYGPTGADTVQWLCGPEASILMAMDRPDLFDALMQVVQERDRLATKRRFHRRENLPEVETTLSGRVGRPGAGGQLRTCQLLHHHVHVAASHVRLGAVPGMLS